MGKIELRILIIDDNPNIHQDVIKVLTVTHKNSDAFNELDEAIFGKKASDAGEDYLPEFIFETASQGQEGVAKIKQATKKGRPYALAFVDIRMPPGWDGIETIKHIWEIDPNIQVIICTAFSDYNWKETIDKLGMSDNFLILKKPFDNIAVRQLACALTQKWLLAKDSKMHTESLNRTVKEQTKSLEHTLSVLCATLKSTTAGVLVVDLQGKAIDYNQHFVNLFDIPKSLLEYNDEKLLHEFILNKVEDSDAYLKQLNIMHKEVDNSNKQTICLNNGKIYECSSEPHRLNELTVGQVFSFRDITERVSMNQKLEHQASHDGLTNLPNRLLLHDRIEQSIASAARNNTFFSILFIDLDRFKLVNDSLGHEFGDQLLCMVAARLSSLVRKEDTIARIGGDEFVMFLPGMAKNTGILTLAHKIITSFQQPFNIDRQDITITSSIGISLYPSNGKTVSKLLKNAELAMYRAKEQGGNQFRFYTGALNQQSNKKLTLEIDLRIAIEKNQFFLVYQPQLDITNQRFLAVEALIRWQHPDNGLILPLAFIPVAEESGLIIPIGEWVIRESCRQINAWRDAGLPYISIAVNVAAKQLKQDDFDKIIAKILKEYKIPAEYIGIEITENVIISHVDVINMINKLRKLGLKIILDDFGTGNSSLNYLTQINIDRLKIDRSFIKNISKSRTDEVIIEAVIAMAKNLQFKVLAEGVDTQTQVDFLKSKSCDEVQGFFYSKPLLPDAIIEELKQLNFKIGEAK